MKSWTAALILLGAACAGGLSKPAEGQLRWPDPPKRAPMRVRLVAVALADRRSSFFSSHEVFVAETEISQDEWSLIKLVFTFLPYQPGLLDAGFDYSVVHEVSASRDPDCDETVAQLTARNLPNRHEPLIYSRHVPREDLDRRNIPLPCYETNADEYIKSSLEPIPPPPQPMPSLRERSSPKPIPLLEEGSSAKEEPSNPTPIPFLGDRSSGKEERSNTKPIPALGEGSSAKEERSNPQPIPFLGDRASGKEERSNMKPIPALGEGSSAKQERSNPQPIPFLGDRAKPTPIPFFNEPANAKNEPSTPKPIPFFEVPAESKAAPPSKNL